MSSLECSMLRPPFESLHAVVRNTQKFVAKDLSAATVILKQLNQSINEANSSKLRTKQPSLSSQSLSPSMSQSPAPTSSKCLSALLTRLAALKQKLEEAEKAAHRSARTEAIRLEFLAQQEAEDSKTRQRYGIAHLPKVHHDRHDRVSEGEHKSEGERRDQHEGDEMMTDGLGEGNNGHTITGSPLQSQMRSNGHGSSSPVTRPRSTSSMAFELSSIPSLTPQPTYRNRLVRICVDHCLRCGHYATAKALIAANPALASLFDTDIFVPLKQVVEGLRRGDFSKALQWCGEHRSRLNKIESSLEFELKIQQFMEIIKRGERDAALEYARKQLAPMIASSTGNLSGYDDSDNQSFQSPSFGPFSLPGSPALRSFSLNDAADTPSAQSLTATNNYRVNRLSQAMNAMLFYNLIAEDAALLPEGSAAYQRYALFWSNDRWRQLETEFRLTHLRVNGLTTHSTLAMVLYAGLSALKTPYCTQPSATDIVTGTNNHSGSQSVKRSRASVIDDTAQVNSLSSTLSLPSSSSAFTPTASHTVSHSHNGHIPSPSSHSSSVLPSSSTTRRREDAQSQSHYHSARHTKCPICSSLTFYQLSESLTPAQRTHSTLICPLTHTVMDDNNPPLVLPSGSVASRAALIAMSDANSGIVTCHRTQQQFRLDQCRQAYVI